MKNFLLASLVGVLMAVTASPPLYAQTVTTMGPQTPVGRTIAQQQIPICTAQATQAYLQYNVVLGQWQCIALQTVTKAVQGLRSPGGAGTAVNMLTVTVPNNTISAWIDVQAFASPGGGSKGDWECAISQELQFSVTRVIGVLTVVNTSSTFGTTTGCVAGASSTGLTLTVVADAVTGGTGGTDTFHLTLKLSSNIENIDMGHAVLIASLKNNVNAGSQVTIQ